MVLLPNGQCYQDEHSGYWFTTQEACMALGGLPLCDDLNTAEEDGELTVAGTIVRRGANFVRYKGTIDTALVKEGPDSYCSGAIREKYYILNETENRLKIVSKKVSVVEYDDTEELFVA
jgi:hypothetical protein